jgi:hydrogenase nickel incorporation protein HypA/HybF
LILKKNQAIGNTARQNANLKTFTSIRKGCSSDMHELAVTEDILKISIEEAQKHEATGVSDIFLTIGWLSSIIDDSVQFYWDHISKDTLCEGATLHFNRPPAVFKCNKCGQEYEIQGDLIPCPVCKSFDLGILSGNEMQVDHIEIIIEGKDEPES